MITHKTICLLVGLVCLALWPLYAPAQGGEWESYMAAGIAAYRQGNYPEAEKKFLAAREQAHEFGPDHPDVATSLNGLAEVYRAQGRYAEAEPLYKRALTNQEKALGPDHPYTATSLNNLAALYQAQGRYAEAEPLNQQALAIWEKALGPEQPNVGESLNKLAVM